LILQFQSVSKALAVFCLVQLQITYLHYIDYFYILAFALFQVVILVISQIFIFLIWFFIWFRWYFYR